MTMAKSSVSAIFYMAALTWMLLVVSGSAAAGRLLANDFIGKGKKVPALFLFGDSTIDAGTNNFLKNPAFLANFSPYGQTYFPRATGRFCDGRLWVDRLAEYLGLPIMQSYLNPSTKDYTQGVDFGSAGSGNVQFVKDTLKTLLGGTVANMDEQLQWFHKVKTSLISSLGSEATEKLVSRSIFIISSGSNDLSWGYALNPTAQKLYTPDQFTSLIIDSIYNAIKTLFDEGAKKIVLNAIGPLGCVPANVATNGSCTEFLNDLAKLFNSKIPAILDRVNANCEGVRVIYIDQYSVVEGFVKNGSKYGFTKGSLACCGIGNYNGKLAGCGALSANGTAIYNLCAEEELDEYVYWDYAHPTEKTYGILADLFINGEGVVKPYNISRLCDY